MRHTKTSLLGQMTENGGRTGFLAGAQSAVGEASLCWSELGQVAGAVANTNLMQNPEQTFLEPDFVRIA